MPVERRKRGTMEIMLDILKSCNQECGVTKVIYGAGINYTVAQKYLDKLIKIGALTSKTENGRKMYEITEKGKILMVHIEEFLKIRENLNVAREKIIELLKVSQ
ncbi:DUF4364 family protein [Sulfolobus tengchongensis]|uniref:DUF4364 family protein n=1 Tax=Sulfolobus tengchongensis TaxID=207809 RepID=A0AAX4KXV5_9CREN